MFYVHRPYKSSICRLLAQPHTLSNPAAQHLAVQLDFLRIPAISIARSKPPTTNMTTTPDIPGRLICPRLTRAQKNDVLGTMWFCGNCSAPNFLDHGAMTEEHPLGVLKCRDCHRPASSKSRFASDVIQWHQLDAIQLPISAHRRTLLGWICCGCGWATTAAPDEYDKRKDGTLGMPPHGRLGILYYAHQQCSHCLSSFCKACPRFELPLKGNSIPVTPVEGEKQASQGAISSSRPTELSMPPANDIFWNHSGQLPPALHPAVR